MPQNVPESSPQSPAQQLPPGWPGRLMAALELGGASPDIARLARMARIAAAASGHDDDAAATAFIAGYAVGLAEGTGQSGFDRAHSASLRAIERLLAAEVSAYAATGVPAGGPAERTAGEAAERKGPRP